MTLNWLSSSLFPGKQHWRERKKAQTENLQRKRDNKFLPWLMKLLIKIAAKSASRIATTVTIEAVISEKLPVVYTNAFKSLSGRRLKLQENREVNRSKAYKCINRSLGIFAIVSPIIVNIQGEGTQGIRYVFMRHIYLSIAKRQSSQAENI